MEDAFQGLDQQSLFNPITKKTFSVMISWLSASDIYKFLELNSN